MILNDLAKHDKKWRQIAYRICNDKMLADDIVQATYLKMVNVNEDKFFSYTESKQKHYVATSLYHTFIDLMRKQKDVRLEELNYVIDHTNNFEPTDEQQELLDEFEKLDWVAKELLLERSTGRSLREIEKIYNINYGFTYRETTKAKKQILNNGRTNR